MLLTKLSAHPEHPGQEWLQMYPAALHNPRAQKQASTWAGLKQATVVLHGRKNSDFHRGIIVLSNNKQKGFCVLLPHIEVPSLDLPM